MKSGTFYCAYYDTLFCFLDVPIYRSVSFLVAIFTYLRIHLCTLIWQKWNWKHGILRSYNIYISHILMSICVTCSIQKSQYVFFFTSFFFKWTNKLDIQYLLKIKAYAQNLKKRRELKLIFRYFTYLFQCRKTKDVIFYIKVLYYIKVI